MRDLVLIPCRRATPRLKDFAAEAAQRAGCMVALVADAPDDAAMSAHEWHLPVAACVAAGYSHLTLTVGAAEHGVTAWDKALCLAAEVDPERLWIAEDDVMFRDPQALADVVAMLDADGADLLAGGYATFEQDPEWSNWWAAAPLIDLVDAVTGFQPFCRLSRALLRKIAGVAAREGRLAFHEILFATLVRQHGLKASVWPRRLIDLRYRPVIPLPEAEAWFAADPARLALHPVKDWAD